MFAGIVGAMRVGDAVLDAWRVGPTLVLMVAVARGLSAYVVDW
jgi:hypothetical protein